MKNMTKVKKKIKKMSNFQDTNNFKVFSIKNTKNQAGFAMQLLISIVIGWTAIRSFKNQQDKIPLFSGYQTATVVNLGSEVSLDPKNLEVVNSPTFNMKSIETELGETQPLKKNFIHLNPRSAYFSKKMKNMYQKDITHIISIKYQNNTISIHYNYLYNEIIVHKSNLNSESMGSFKLPTFFYKLATLEIHWNQLDTKFAVCFKHCSKISTGRGPNRRVPLVVNYGNVRDSKFLSPVPAQPLKAS
jgi:hypothetical protein